MPRVLSSGSGFQSSSLPSILITSSNPSSTSSSTSLSTSHTLQTSDAFHQTTTSSTNLVYCLLIVRDSLGKASHVLKKILPLNCYLTSSPALFQHSTDMSAVGYIKHDDVDVSFRRHLGTENFECTGFLHLKEQATELINATQLGLQNVSPVFSLPALDFSYDWFPVSHYHPTLFLRTKHHPGSMPHSLFPSQFTANTECSLGSLWCITEVREGKQRHLLHSLLMKT
jgi:hypothetical protein